MSNVNQTPRKSLVQLRHKVFFVAEQITTETRPPGKLGKLQSASREEDLRCSIESAGGDTSRKNRKKVSSNIWFKDLLSGLIRLTIFVAVLLSGNDYQITTVIQLYTSHHEAQNATTLSKHHYS